MVFAVAYIIIFFIADIIFSISNMRLYVNDLRKRLIYIFFIVSLAVVAYCMKPPSTWDLSRNYILLDIIRNSQLSFNQFVFGGNATYGADGYRSLIFYNIYRFIFVKVFDNNAWFQTITTIIVYALQFYIIYDYKKVENKENIPISLILLLSFTFMPFVYVVSGIRNALAASIMGVAIYLYLYKKIVLKAILLVIMAITIHPSVVIALPFVILCKMNLGSKGILCVAISSFGFQLIASVFSNSSVFFLRQIGESYLLYSGNNQYRGGRGNLYGILIVSIFFILYFLWNRKNKTNKETENDINNFLMLLLVYMVGNFLNYDLVLRPGYIVSMFAPLLANKMQDLVKKRNLKLILNFLLILTCLYVNYKCFQILIEAF